MTMSKTGIDSFDGFIVLEVMFTLGQLKLCKANSDGEKVKEGDEFLAKPFQITKFETAKGNKLRIKENHIIGIMNEDI